jgi:hypothetical protein
VLISHHWEDPDDNIGWVQKLEAVPGYGLVAHMKLDLTNERARTVHKLLSERRMVEFSVAYDLYDEASLPDHATLLKRMHLHEISVVLKGAAGTQGQPDGRTQLLSVKSTTIMDESSNNDPAFMRRKIEAAAEGRDLTPDDYTREKRQAERSRPVVSNEVPYGDTITGLSSWNAEPDPAEGESFRVEFPIVVE